ncbi:ribosome small subunit-dependent GTPase A [Leptospira inadai serovar Lyme str. 10]|uniref:Small ribosomal subunit biogenesis GTPase RsgA n=2 Tax=Leptospira inadai serovar Lyme TaxID=293084 RepID=V6H8D0_9LEPT|nr:ribosome small subunit-dependent GTPase A [Leptospira inadai]EQA34952.1 ribosome small subunit-dependent GTPase A [Leptospira inadai serovar Lyme str. 10]PNV73689.1 ribosome small subunit-dependent GTPase A [Leptospira inadai serovar Lyme]
MNHKPDLSLSAWDRDREREFQIISSLFGLPESFPARIIGEQGQEFKLQTAFEEGIGILTGALRFGASSILDLPIAGDWVLATKMDSEQFLIHSLLPRRSLLVRKSKGNLQRPDPICANMDYIFLLHGLDGDFQPRRLERTLVQLWESGALPVIVLTKKDLYRDNQDELFDRIAQVTESCPGVRVHSISIFESIGLEELADYWSKESTSAFIGSSGVGKSSLLNLLLGKEFREVQNVRESDSKGKHTTSNRWMFRLSSGAWILDNPGMREIQLWSDGSGLAETFPEILEAVKGCKFPDCSHHSEPNCGVKVALEQGRISKDRFKSYLKLQRELSRNAQLASPTSREARAQKAKCKSIHREQKRLQYQREKERYQ